MESLPVELLRLIYQFCDPGAVRALRLCSGKLAEVGEEYLVDPVFRSLPWRDDVKRLHALSSHERLNAAIEALVINFAQMDEHNGRHTSYLQHFYQDPEECSALLHEAWHRYYEAEECRQDVPAFSSQAALVHEAFARLPNLKDLRVTFTESPHDIEPIRQAFRLPGCRKMDRKQACADLNVLISAVSTANLTSLEIDRLPLELFKVRHSRQHWLECAPALANLRRLNITLDSSEVQMPTTKFRAMNGLGHFLRYAPNVEHLGLGFHNYSRPREKYQVWFGELFGPDFVFGRLTDLKLEGIACDEEDLRGRLLPNLERLHLQGDFECGMLISRVHEKYNFHPVTREDWEEIPEEIRRSRVPRNTTDGLEFERFVLHGGEYPGTHSATPSATPSGTPSESPAGTPTGTLTPPTPESV
ncbi:hypothetical protein MAPG_01781 [Magnaporthiopsis poae ATCC 64411]|uniref:F-box domain-containing protein n=1 Tax=Magnaporthiopsis poae (strain ATCC 64411 / 73-15) TaxID=644358 RepID=A0A0C4DPL2_MAGP6|nr:hypothetical protein MAPG_01781 [Magnaporthiopsis poae ATCC 64411]